MKALLIVRSVVATWAAVLVSALAGVFLTPYILHRLGDEGYGLWVLVVTLTDYYLFLRVGIRSAIVRYVSKSLAVHDSETVNKVLATSFYFYVGMMCVVFIASFFLSPFVSHMFSVHPENAGSFAALFLLVGLANGFDFPLNVFEGALEAAGRFDQIYGIRIAGLILRIVLVVLVLERGGHLFAVGAVTVLSALVLRFAAIPLAYMEVESFSIHPRGIDSKVFKEMLRFGLTSFSVGVGERLNSSLYPLVIGRFLSASAVTLYSLPTKMLTIPLNGIGSMTEFVNPLSSRLQATDDRKGLWRVVMLSGQAAYLIFAPLAVVMILLGKQLLTVWVGPNYAWTYPLLVLLTFGLGLDATQYSMQSMLFGMGKHKGLVWVRLFQGLGAATLGAVLLHPLGILGYGLAATSISLLVNLILLPRAVCVELSMQMRKYYVKGCLEPALLSLPLLLAMLAFLHFNSASSWNGLAGAVLVGSIAHVLTLLLATWYAQNWPDGWFSVELLGTLADRFQKPKAIRPGTVVTSVSSELG
jgi:O-antigen/teichoic acid export membrane protein